MSNKRFYTRLGIEKGDPLTLMQIIQIAQMRSQESAVTVDADEALSVPLSTANAGHGDVEDIDIVEAVYSLDPDDDRHWTRMGLPAMKSIEVCLGTSRVNRAEIERVLPGYNRTSARG